MINNSCVESASGRTLLHWPIYRAWLWRILAVNTPDETCPCVARATWLIVIKVSLLRNPFQIKSLSPANVESLNVNLDFIKDHSLKHNYMWYLINSPRLFYYFKKTLSTAIRSTFRIWKYLSIAKVRVGEIISHYVQAHPSIHLLSLQFLYFFILWRIFTTRCVASDVVALFHPSHDLRRIRFSSDSEGSVPVLVFNKLLLNSILEPQFMFKA